LLTRQLSTRIRNKTDGMVSSFKSLGVLFPASWDDKKKPKFWLNNPAF